MATPRSTDMPEDPYPKGRVGGYSVRMSSELSESFLSPTTLLWLVVVVIAGVLLFGSINRRRIRLTETLRDYVAKHKEGPEAEEETSSE